MECAGCKREDCGTCRDCKDMVKFGGPVGKSKSVLLGCVFHSKVTVKESVFHSKMTVKVNIKLPHIVT